MKVKLAPPAFTSELTRTMFSSIIDPIPAGSFVVCHSPMHSVQKTRPLTILYLKTQGEIAQTEIEDSSLLPRTIKQLELTTPIAPIFLNRFLSFYTELHDPNWYEEVASIDIDYLIALQRRLENEEVGTFLICYAAAERAYHLYAKTFLNHEVVYGVYKIELSARSGYKIIQDNAQYRDLETFDEIKEEIRLTRGMFEPRILGMQPPKCIRPAAKLCSRNSN